jgi:hypothetical protein
MERRKPLVGDCCRHAGIAGESAMSRCRVRIGRTFR